MTEQPVSQQHCPSLAQSIYTVTETETRYTQDVVPYSHIDLYVISINLVETETYQHGFYKRIIPHKKNIKASLLFDWQWQRQVAKWVKCDRDLQETKYDTQLHEHEMLISLCCNYHTFIETVFH